MARPNEQDGNASGETMTAPSPKMDDRLTREQIEQWRIALCDPEEFHAPALAELNALCDLALSALRQDSSGRVTFDQWWKDHGYDYGTLTMQVARNAWNAAPQESRSEVLGFFAIGCSNEHETLWLYKFSGGTNGSWGTDPQQALVFIHKQQADDVMTIPGIAAYHPFCQWITSRAEPGAPDRKGNDPLRSTPGSTAATPEPSVDYARGLEEGAKVCDEVSKMKWDRGAASECARQIRAKIKPAKGEL